MQNKSKNDIRKTVLELLRNQKEEDRLRKSRNIRDRLFAIVEFQRARTILFYASFDGEVETFEMMKQAKDLKKRIALPIIKKDHKRIVPSLLDNFKEGLETGPYGIKQPSDKHYKKLELKELDLVIVPGVAFDKKNYRLGRGAGYYDRFLSELPGDIPAFGLAFDFQIFESLPHQEHDVPLSRVIIN